MMRIAARRYHWKTGIKNWLPVCFWAGLIFFFSTDYFSFENTAQILGFVFSWLAPEMPTEEFAPVHGPCVNSAIGANTSSWQFYSCERCAMKPVKSGNWRHAVLTLAFIFVYALSDELHQSFVPSRTASFGDVMIDVLGGISGIFLDVLVFPRHPHPADFPNK